MATFFNSAFKVGATAVKTNSGHIFAISLKNLDATDAYIQMFDLATTSVTLGTTAPKLSFWVPASGAYDLSLTNDSKIDFKVAITIASSTAATGSTAPTTGIVTNIIYQ